MDLTELRREIDQLDDAIVDCLRRRAALVKQVATVKEHAGEGVYRPAREREILARVTATERLGEFPPASAATIFREVINACRGLEEPLRVSYLGPAGTFTELAARDLFGHSANYDAARDFDTVFDAVAAGQANCGVVPVENSTAGTIREVLDLLACRPLRIVREAYVDIQHCLLSNATLDDITVVYSKDTALAQCRRWLREHLPRAVLTAVASTTRGAELAAAEPTAAAIAPQQAAAVYSLAVVAAGIQDRHNNRTRFFAVGHRLPPPSGADKTSLLLSVPHRPGSLVAALGVIREHELNMTLIESRPSTEEAFEYVFYIDVEGHIDDPQVAAAVAELKCHCLFVKVLGSYPRADG